VIWLSVAVVVLAVALVAQALVHRRERRHLTNLAVARTAPGAVAVAEAARPHRQRKTEERKPPKMSEAAID